MNFAFSCSRESVLHSFRLTEILMVNEAMERLEVLGKIMGLSVCP